MKSEPYYFRRNTRCIPYTITTNILFIVCNGLWEHWFILILFLLHTISSLLYLVQSRVAMMLSNGSGLLAA